MLFIYLDWLLSTVFIFLDCAVGSIVVLQLPGSTLILEFPSDSLVCSELSKTNGRWTGNLGMNMCVHGAL